MENKESLINFDGASDVINNLIDKLAAGAGWLANRETPKKLAMNTYIEEIKEKDYDPLTKAALISNAKKTIKEYCNQYDIVNIAIQSLQSTSEPEKIEDDWVGKFMDKARLVSSEEFQVIWGRILASECNAPGSIPVSLLYALEKMDKEDAETFTSLCRITVHLGDECAPVVIGSKFDEYESLLGITLDKLISLNSLGLIEMNLGIFSGGYSLTTSEIPEKVTYFDKQYELYKEKEIRVGNVLYTKSGQALCQAINVDELDGYWEQYCIPFWEENTNDDM